MKDQLTLGARLFKVITPTRLQLLICIFGSLIVIAVLESNSILVRLGLTKDSIQSSGDQLQSHFTSLSNSSLASNIALVAFWSVVGLVAYLICWAGYNFVVEARNEVTLKTQYENQGRSGGPWLTLAVKTLACAGLLAVVFTFHAGLNLTLNLVQPIITQFLVANVFAALAGVIVLSVQLYLVIVFLELVFSAWYRPQAFTDI